MVETVFVILFLMVFAWALFLTNHLGQLRRQNKQMSEQYVKMKKQYNLMKDHYDKAFELGKQYAYKDMASEIKNTIKKAQDDA